MLILTRQANAGDQSEIIIETMPGHVKVVVLEIKGKNVKLGIEAPRPFAIHRAEPEVGAGTAGVGGKTE